MSIYRTAHLVLTNGLMAAENHQCTVNEAQRGDEINLAGKDYCKWDEIKFSITRSSFKQGDPSWEINY